MWRTGKRLQRGRGGGKSSAAVGDTHVKRDITRHTHGAHVTLVVQYKLLKRPRTLKWRHGVGVVSITCTMEDGRVEQLQVPPLHVSLLLLLQVTCSSPSCFFLWLLLMDMRRNVAGTCPSLLQPRRCMCNCRSSGGSSMRCYCTEHV